jgi:hypothetical protein
MVTYNANFKASAYLRQRDFAVLLDIVFDSTVYSNGR